MSLTLWPADSNWLAPLQRVVHKATKSTSSVQAENQRRVGKAWRPACVSPRGQTMRSAIDACLFLGDFRLLTPSTVASYIKGRAQEGNQWTGHPPRMLHGRMVSCPWAKQSPWMVAEFKKRLLGVSRSQKSKASEGPGSQSQRKVTRKVL